MEKEINTSLFRTPYIEFGNHLELPSNNRILFSGRYGTGKTTFLKWYFSDSEQAKKYNHIHLFPINYSVATNEDIFKYIKMDILIYLLEHAEINIDHIEISNFEYLPYFISENIFDLFTTSVLVFAAAKGDVKITSSIISKLESIKGKFTAYASKTKEQLSDVKKLKTFTNELLAKEGSLYEFNFISELIVQILKQWQENSKKEIVLVIDDLDRIDPHHIFRILNVFAAHFDHKTSTEQNNKFGFQKVILVGDIENLKNIFHNNFGLSADFCGYIDKFYSHSVFMFNNVHDVREIVHSLNQKTKLVFDDHLTYDSAQRYVSLLQVHGRNNIEELEDFLSAFYLIGKMNFRMLGKKQIIIANKIIAPNTSISNWNFPFVIKIESLIHILGSESALREALSQAQRVLNRKFKFKRYLPLLSEALPLFNFESLIANNSYSVDSLNCSYTLCINRNIYYANDIKSTKYPHSPITGSSSEAPSIFDVYLEGLDILSQTGYLSK